jgi:hypothetical protein
MTRASAAIGVFAVLLVIRSLAVFSTYFFQVDEVALAVGAVALVRGNGAGIYHYTPQFGYYRLVEGIDLLVGGRITLVPAIIKALSAAAGALIPTLGLFAFPHDLTVRQRWVAVFVLAANPIVWMTSQYGNTALVATALASSGLIVLTNDPGRAGRIAALVLFALGVFVRADTVLLTPVVVFLLYRSTGAAGPTLKWTAALGVALLAVYAAVLAFDPMADNALLAVSNHMTAGDDRHFWGFLLWSLSPIPLLFALWGLRCLAMSNRGLLVSLVLWCVPTLVFYAPSATIPRYFLNVAVPLSLAAAVGVTTVPIAPGVALALAGLHLVVGLGYLPWDRGITAPLRGGSAPTQAGEELPTGALLYRTFSNRGILAWSLPNPQFGKTNRFWEASTFPRALDVLADPTAPRRTVVVLMSGGWNQALHYHAEIAGARYLSRRPSDGSGPVTADTWMTIGNARVEALDWRPIVYDLVPRFDVSAGDEIWVLGRKPFPDNESLHKLPPGLSLVAAGTFDPNVRVFRVAAAS